MNNFKLHNKIIKKLYCPRMNIQLNLSNYIIVLGTTYSGSQAAYDYLAGRGDLYDPLLGTEYILPQMPNGLMTLEAISDKSFHPGTADYVLYQFENSISKLSRSRKLWRYGENYSALIPSFKKQAYNFINEISAAKLPLRLQWRRQMQSNIPLLYFLNKLKKFFFFKKSIAVSRLISSKENLITAAQNFHQQIFLSTSNNRRVLLNQAGSGWNPIESTKYFLNRKIILILRDPRDQFSDIKNYKDASSVTEYVHWYSEMRRRLKQINDQNILILQFENFVNQNDKIIEQICNYLSLSINIHSNYEPNLSKKNIGIYKKYLNQKEIDVIEKSLSEYIQI